MNIRTRSHLSPARKRLLEIIDSLGFGVIDGLNIVDGEPCFDSPLKVFEDIKIGCVTPAPQTLGSDRDFALKSRVVELFEHFDRIGCAKIKLEIKHSAAFRVVVERDLRGTNASASE
jgi:hypothetical protein